MSPLVSVRSSSSTLENIIQVGTIATRMLREIADATNAPYLKTIAGISSMIIDTVQTVRTNKQECAQMTERVYGLICAIINVCGDSQLELSPSMLYSIAQFTETLQKLLSYVRIQAEGTLMRRIRRHMEIATLLADCNKGLQHAMDVFGVQSTILTSVALARMQVGAERRHHEIMGILTQKLSDQGIQGAGRSTSSLSLLPASPQVFNGREAELQQIVSTLVLNKLSRIAILGQGGIGKTSLALAVLHHPDVVNYFGSHRYFAACDGARSANELLAVIAATCGISEEKKPSKAIIHYLNSRGGPCLMVLDNFESPWEAAEVRSKVEDVLALLGDVCHLSIIVTMRGVERPFGVRWTRPFFPPLQPLSDEAAKRTFIDLSDLSHDEPGLPELLGLTDNLPLAVALLARLASYEGCNSLARRWREESTTLLSDGVDKSSNLDTSISISLSSSRLKSTPDAHELLSLLSLLPDGVSDTTLHQLQLPIREVLKCKANLCRTSLSYMDLCGRLRVLAPVREYVRRIHPPAGKSVLVLQRYFYGLVELTYSSRSLASRGLLQQVTNNIGNIHSIIHLSLQETASPCHETIRCIIQLSIISDIIGSSVQDLLQLDSVKNEVNTTKDNELRGWYYFALASVQGPGPSLSVIQCYIEAVRCFELVDHSEGKISTWIMLAYCHSCEASEGLQKSKEYCNKALMLSERVSDPALQARAIYVISVALEMRGTIHDALMRLQNGRELSTLAGSTFYEAIFLAREGYLYLKLGNFKRCAIFLAEASSIFTALGLTPALCSAFSHVISSRAALHYFKTEYATARELLNLIADSEVYVTPRMLIERANALSNLAEIDIITGKAFHSKVKRNLDKAEALYKQMSASVDLACLGISKAHLYFLKQQHTLAKMECFKCLSSIPESCHWNLLRCFELLGDIYSAEGKMPSAMHHYTTCFALARKSRNMPYTYQTLRHIGDIFMGQDHEETALSLYRVALDGFETMDIYRGKADCMARIGNIQFHRGNIETARNLWEISRELFEMCQREDDMVKCIESLELLRVSH